MPTYLFSDQADKRQDEIWRYTYNQHGGKQTVQYIKELHQHLQKLADKTLPWRSFDIECGLSEALRKQVYRSLYKQHIIFFKELPSSNNNILTILHQSMDIPNRLANDLL